MLDRRGSGADLEVDEGIKPSSLRRVVDAGADVVVVDNARFDVLDPGRAARGLRAMLDYIERSTV